MNLSFGDCYEKDSNKKCVLPKYRNKIFWIDCCSPDFLNKIIHVFLDASMIGKHVLAGTYQVLYLVPAPPPMLDTTWYRIPLEPWRPRNSRRSSDNVRPKNFVFGHNVWTRNAVQPDICIQITISKVGAKIVDTYWKNLVIISWILGILLKSRTF